MYVNFSVSSPQLPTLIDIKYWFGDSLSLKDFIQSLKMLVIIEYFWWSRFNDGITSFCLFFARWITLYVADGIVFISVYS